MQTKNKLSIYIFHLLVFLFISSFNLNADEFNISAEEISIDKQNNILIGKGAVEVIDNEGKVIKANKVIYDKNKNFITVHEFVEIFDSKGNILKTEKATYDKKKGKIITYKNSQLMTEDGYKVTSNKIIYDNLNKIISSDQNSILTDLDNNKVIVNMFQYHIEKYLFSSIGKIKVIDTKNNKYFFKELHADTKKNEMIGSDVSVILDQANFGLDENTDPRFVANDIFLSKDKSKLSKGVFTVCKQKEDQCPPWSLQAKEISHDRVKKTIYYKNASLKLYDVPIFYFPKFFHPDPTVKRQSGFLAPFFTDASNLGSGFGLPYYWAISGDKDLTFTPKIYSKENPLFLNEYRQAFRNSFLILDTSYTAGYNETTTTKTKGSRNHIFGQLDMDFSKDLSYENNLSLKIQRTSNDTYFRVHDIETKLVETENTNLKNEITYNFKKDDYFLGISGYVYEDLRKDNSKYEYILPNILVGKSFFTERFGDIDLKSNFVHRNYQTNKHTTKLLNDLIWRPGTKITKNGFVNTVEGIVRNSNYKAKNTSNYKNDETTNQFNGVLSFKSSLPMQKKGENSSKIFSPTFMIKYAPGHMRNLSEDDLNLNYANLYSINKTSEIDNGLAAILGFDYKLNEKNKDNIDREKLSISIGQVFNAEQNSDMPNSSSLGQKSSDLVGSINYNFSEIGNVNYKFSLDHNYSDLNYNEISTNLNFGKVAFNINYLEEQNHVGNEHYVDAGLSLNINDRNTLKFSTKKNYKTESTELYNMSYQYKIDCLTAGLVFRREFYEDSDIEPKDSLLFTITFVPFTSVNSPSINP